jgi:outer membrane murein-binding lipoprotein Lpp
MPRETVGHDAPTRRDYVKYGGALLGGTLLAGCSSRSGSSPAPTEGGSDTSTEAATTGAPRGTSTEAATATEPSTEAATEPPTEARTTGEPTTGVDATTGGQSTYSVAIEPVEEVTFDAVPERWIAYQYAYGDMGAALGRADSYLGTNKPGNYLDFFYDELPDVEFVDPDVDWQGAGRHAPASDFAAAVQVERFDRDLIIELGGRGSATARFLPLLIVSKARIDEIATIFDKAVATVANTEDDRVGAVA